MTKKLQKSLGIKSLPSNNNSEKPQFLDEWYMNYFNIKSQWFFIFLESSTFYTVVKPATQINGSEMFTKYFMEILIEIINKENDRYKVRDFSINDMHLRNTENKAERRIMVDMVFHAERMKFKKGKLDVFEMLNDIPQALLDYNNPRIVFRKKLFELLNEGPSISMN